MATATQTKPKKQKQWIRSATKCMCDSGPTSVPMEVKDYKGLVQFKGTKCVMCFEVLTWEKVSMLQSLNPAKKDAKKIDEKPVPKATKPENPAKKVEKAAKKEKAEQGIPEGNTVVAEQVVDSQDGKKTDSEIGSGVHGDNVNGKSITEPVESDPFTEPAPEPVVEKPKPEVTEEFTWKKAKLPIVEAIKDFEKGQLVFRCKLKSSVVINIFAKDKTKNDLDLIDCDLYPGNLLVIRFKDIKGGVPISAIPENVVKAE